MTLTKHWNAQYRLYRDCSLSVWCRQADFLFFFLVCFIFIPVLYYENVFVILQVFCNSLRLVPLRCFYISVSYLLSVSFTKKTLIRRCVTCSHARIQVGMVLSPQSPAEDLFAGGISSWLYSLQQPGMPGHVQQKPIRYFQSESQRPKRAWTSERVAVGLQLLTKPSGA